MRTAIIENETKAQRLLFDILKAYCRELQVVGIAATINKGRQLITEHQPELLFLDIQLDDGDGFDLLDILEQQNLKVIFTTAYDSYAIKAFKYETVDYLLKPITPKEVMKAVEKVKRMKDSHFSLEQLKSLLKKDDSDTLRISTSEAISLLQKSDIVRIEGDGAYATIHLADGESEMVSQSIGQLENEINKPSFLRIHTSHLINQQYLRKYIKEDGGYALMKDGVKVPVSRRKKELIKF